MYVYLTTQKVHKHSNIHPRIIAAHRLCPKV